MKITLQRLNNAVHMQAMNEDGNTIDIDGAPEIGGENKGFRPMQLLAAGAGACSSIDIVSILQKQREELKDLKVEISAEREAGKTPSLFTTIHLHYILSGNPDPKKVERALELSLTKYCSVVKILEKTAEISYTYEIIPN
jgi:putative redox protein